MNESVEIRSWWGLNISKMETYLYAYMGFYQQVVTKPMINDKIENF